MGELVAVRRCDLNLDAGTVRISRKFAELRDGRRVAGPPKSAAGVRRRSAGDARRRDETTTG
jgi:hypothetical protein